MDFEDIVSHFEHPKRITTGKGCQISYQCKCSAHDDTSPSLTISLSKNNKILMHCHAGCRFEDIVERAGMTMDEVIGQSTKLTCFDKLAWYYSNKYIWEDKAGKKHKGYGEGVKIIAEYPYYAEDGRYLYSKIRFEGGKIDGKLIRYYYVDKYLDKAETITITEKTLYNLRNFQKLRHKAQFTYIVEGEKDCETLKKLGHGFGCVTTAGGASDWKEEYAPYFKGLNVIILRDNDEAGIKNAEVIERSLLDFAHYVKTVSPSKLDHGDVTDYLTKEGGTAQSLKELCQSVTEVSFARWVKTDDKFKESGILTGILAECISKHEKYIIVRNPKDDKDVFYSYEHGVYIQKNKPEVKAMIREYIPESRVTDNMLNNTHSLLYATNDHIYSMKMLNADSRYINFKNGLYDIYSKKLIEHSPDVLSTIQFQFNYDPNNNSHPVFDKYITDLCTKYDGSVDQDEIKIIQEYMGFLISNEPMQKIKTALVLWSRLGNSGKSVLIRLLSNLFGLDRVASIKLKELTIDNRFILGTLPECRLIACGDESNSNVEDSSIFKSLTGGDPVKIEPKGKQGYSYIYTGGFVIACNGLPCFLDDKGEHLFNRLMILPCEHHITEENKDSELDMKLENEIPAILNWMLEGLNRLIKNKYVFTKSKSSARSKEEYRMAMDNVYRFVIENFEITHDRNDTYPKRAFNNKYLAWATTSDENIKRVEAKNIPARLEMIGIYQDYGNYQDQHHIAVYRCIKPLLPSLDKTDEGFYDPTDEERKSVPF